MFSSLRSLSRLLLLSLLLVPAACSEQIQTWRVQRFAQQAPEPITVAPSARSVSLRVTPAGQSLTPDSLNRLNAMLRAQGRLQTQSVTVLPATEAGRTFSPRLVAALAKNGLPASRIRVTEDRPAINGAEATDDLLVVSEAMVVTVPDCGIAKPDTWTVEPYQGIGGLGCANRANLARMVSDPRDLVRPRVLDPADGVQAERAVRQYQEDDMPDLIDINFNEDD